ncbi:MAG: hypothetical protein M3Y08_18215 [Fibrobacterota bacterium]|nr:hypothetical protein [Fibrobacterota bacterium]
MGPIYAETSETLSWASGNASRTIGTGANLSTTRPQQILMASLTISGTEYPLSLLTNRDYQAISSKTMTSTIPFYLAYNPTFTTAFGTLYLYPVPSGAVSLLLTSLKPIADITGAGTLAFPPGYEDAFVTNLAVRFADGEFAADISPGLRQEALDARVRIARLNDITQEMMPDYMAPGLECGGDYVNRWTN